MAELGSNPEQASAPELLSNMQRRIESVVSGVDFHEKDSVYRTYLKEFEAVRAAAGKNPNVFESVMDHVYAAGKQAEFMVKDFVYWMMRGGPIGAAYRFVGEHLPGPAGQMYRNADRAVDAMFKPSEREKRRVAELTAIRVTVGSTEKRVGGIVNWIMGRR